MLTIVHRARFLGKGWSLRGDKCSEQGKKKHQCDREDNEGVLSGAWKLKSKNGMKNIAPLTVYHGKMILF